MSEIGRIGIERFQKECERTEAQSRQAESSFAAPGVRRFRVSLERLLPDPRIRNPFLIKNWEGLESKVLVRTWEFDAADENEVRRLLDEARQSGEPQVQGMRVRSIEEISPNDPDQRPGKSPKTL